MRRFRVAEDSMRPALAPGDEFVVTDIRPAAVGEIVALPHPHRDDFWLVKRLAAIDGDVVDGHGRLAAGQAWVVSDNDSAHVTDSRSFGPVSANTLRPAVRRLDEPLFREGADLLTGEDPALGQLVSTHGIPRFWSRPAGFPTLVWLVLEQQVSLESGAAMLRRVAAAGGAVTPESIVSLGETGLREIGVTRQKTGYLLGMATMSLDGGLPLDDIALAEPVQAREALLAVKGIGPWTADAYLLSALRFPDVFPVGDRALQVGTAEVLGLGSVPTESELELLSAPWRPLRAVAARLIWHSYLTRRGRVEPADPTPGHPTTQPA